MPYEIIVDCFGFGEFQVDSPLLQLFKEVHGEEELPLPLLMILLHPRRTIELEHVLLVVALTIVHGLHVVDVLKSDDTQGILFLLSL